LFTNCGRYVTEVANTIGALRADLPGQAGEITVLQNAVNSYQQASCDTAPSPTAAQRTNCPKALTSIGTSWTASARPWPACRPAADYGGRCEFWSAGRTRRRPRDGDQRRLRVGHVVPQPKLGTVEPVGTVRLTPSKRLRHWAAVADTIGPDTDRGVEVVAVRTSIASLSDAAVDAHDMYLRLHLLSWRLVPPHGQNLDGVFGLLSNVVWTNHGPCPVDGFESTRLALRSRGPVTVYGVDKFPRMVDYVLRPACALLTPTGFGWAHIWPVAPRSCTRAS